MDPGSRNVIRMGGTDGIPVSWKALILTVVVMLFFLFSYRPVSQYLHQRAQYDDVAQQVEDTRATNEALEEELAKWDDDAYVETQARERLSYVMPGETTYLVVDADTVASEETTSDSGGETTAAHTPWYITLKDSAYVAGEIDDDDELSPAQQGWTTEEPSETATEEASATATPSEEETP